MARIAIYDSGVGGLSVYKDIRQVCPDHEYVFVSDNEAYPYGTKAEPELMSRVLKVSERILDVLQPDILVLACNTASTVCLPKLRRNTLIPVVGVVPAIKPAAKSSNTKVLGLLATPATINRSYTESLIDDFAANCEFIKVGSTELVNLAERKLQGREVSLDELTQILEPFIKSPELDTLVLACTHFPLLKDEITAVFEASNRTITLIDSGKGIASRVQTLSLDLQPMSPANNIALFTSKIESLEFKAALKLLGFDNIQSLNIPFDSSL